MMLSLEEDIVFYTKRATREYPKGVYLACTPLSLHESKLINYFTTNSSNFQIYKFKNGLIEELFVLRCKGEE